jgi:hypothetical protein
MSHQLFRIVYCSRNLIEGSAADVTTHVRQILNRSRANNAALSVTGALIYNSGYFAQALEGPVNAVGQIFEKIQRDGRHSEVTVVEDCLTEDRHFADWSMAFSSGGSPDPTQRVAEVFGAVFTKTPGAGKQMLTVLRELVQQEDDWILTNAV